MYNQQEIEKGNICYRRVNEEQFVCWDQYERLQFLKQKHGKFIIALTREPLGMKPPQIRSYFAKEWTR